MRRRIQRLLVLAAVGALTLVGGLGGGEGRAAAEQRPVINLALLSPLTGPLSFVGQDNREGALAAVREINRSGGIRGRPINLEVFDDTSNPSQGVVNMRQIASNSKYVGVIGSGFSSVGLAVQPIVSSSRIPYISMASAAAQVTPAKPYYFMTTATSRLFAYAMAPQLRRMGIRRIALMGDNGGFGREGVANVKELARRFGFEIVADITFPLNSTSFVADLTRVRNTNAQALWVWNATALAVTLTKEMRQLRLP